jgi:predicted small lipoprotein YifL
MAVRVLLVLAIFLTLCGCGQQSAQHQHPDKKEAAAPPKNKKSTVEEKVGDSAKVDLQPANGSGTRGTATFSKADGGVKVVLKVTGLPNSGTMYLAHVHPGTCAEEEKGEQRAGEHGHSHHEHGASEEIEYPLTPVDPDAKGNGRSTTVVHNVTLEGLLSGEPKHVNVHRPGSGEPPPVTCANLNEAL